MEMALKYKIKVFCRLMQESAILTSKITNAMPHISFLMHILSKKKKCCKNIVFKYLSHIIGYVYFNLKSSFWNLSRWSVII